MNRASTAGLRIAAVAALLAGIGALCLARQRLNVAQVSWEDLLAPYSRGTALPDGFAIATIRRGADNDVIVTVNRPGEPTGVEVHVLARGRWRGVRESQSFSIAYETPHSPAPQRDAITHLFAEAIRSRDSGLPAPDAIPLRPGPDATVLPWWLDILRGWRGLLLGASLILIVAVVLIPVAAPTIAALVLAAIDVVAAVGGVSSGHALAGGWFVPAAALLLFAALRRRLAISHQDRRLALAIAIVAAGLRFGLGPWGPLHVNGYAPNFVFAAVRDPGITASYGPGYAELFAPIAAIVPSNPDWAIFACNAILSTLAVTLAFALGRLCGIPPLAAMAAALVLAADPIAIRMSATESYFNPIVFLCAAAAVALLAASREHRDGAHWGATACLVAGALLLGQAARIHPGAWVATATVPFVALAAAGIAFRQRVLFLLASAMLIGGLMIATSGGSILDILGHMRSGVIYRPPLPHTYLPLAWVAGSMLLYVLIAPQPWLAVPAGIAAAALLLTWRVFWESWIWQQSAARLYLTLPVVALVGGVPAFLQRRSVAFVAALLAAFAWFRFGLPIVIDRTTDHLEYRWVRDELLRLPSDCRVVHVASVGKRELILPTYVRPQSAPAVAIDQDEPHTIAEALSPTACMYYVHTSLCSSDDGRPMCDAIENRLVLAPVARASFPARPSRDLIPYDRDPIETVIARVERLNGAEAHAE